MTEAEGVIKFNLTFTETPLAHIDISELNAWRTILKLLGLLGQAPDRYDGYGFGNVSMRVGDGFLITGTQTGGLEELTLDEYALCTAWQLEDNQVLAEGAVRPSSESLSHAAVYDVHESVNCALHVHSPEIWQNADTMGIVVTDRSVAYGTPEMAWEVRRHIQAMQQPGIFAMGGHEDGIFTFGRNLQEAGNLMVSELARAISM